MSSLFLTPISFLLPGVFSSPALLRTEKALAKAAINVLDQTALRRYLINLGNNGIIVCDPISNKCHTEGISYLMKVLSLSARPNDQKYFDLLLKALINIFMQKKGRPPAWLVSKTGRIIDGNSATDANQDIISALEKAVENICLGKWAGFGKISKYKKIIQILKNVVRKSIKTIKYKGGSINLVLPDYNSYWARVNNRTYLINPSYFTTSYYIKWGWNKTARDCYKILGKLLSKFGHIPDWVVISVTKKGKLIFRKPRRVKREWNNKKTHEGAEAIRVPWRLAQDNSQSAKKLLTKMLKGKTPYNVKMISWNNELAVAMYYSAARSLGLTKTNAFAHRLMGFYNQTYFGDSPDRYYNNMLCLLAIMSSK